MGAVEFVGERERGQGRSSAERGERDRARRQYDAPHYDRDRPSVNLVEGDAQALPFAEAASDKVVCARRG